ncbi:hypothetical protein EBB07_24830 [Paenibacillaceae bacterium]|nr:hypothetical protein EBB07_24830 [Paenibacillaceae bacterium]
MSIKHLLQAVHKDSGSRCFYLVLRIERSPANGGKSAWKWLNGAGFWKKVDHRNKRDSVQNGYFRRIDHPLKLGD